MRDADAKGWSVEQLTQVDDDMMRRRSYLKRPAVVLYIAGCIGIASNGQLMPELPLWTACVLAAAAHALLMFGVPASMRFIDTCLPLEKGGPGLMWWAGAAVASLMSSWGLMAIASGALICWLLGDILLLRKYASMAFRKRLAAGVLVLCDVLFVVDICLQVLA